MKRSLSEDNILGIYPIRKGKDMISIHDVSKNYLDSNPHIQERLYILAPRMSITISLYNNEEKVKLRHVNIYHELELRKKYLIERDKIENSHTQLMDSIRSPRTLRRAEKMSPNQYYDFKERCVKTLEANQYWDAKEKVVKTIPPEELNLAQQGNCVVM